MVGIYFSGTGNTKHCVEALTELLNPGAKCCALENAHTEEEIRKADSLVFGYPTQYSNAPFFVREYIQQHAELWQGKQILCLSTMGLFSGDGAGCTARLFKRYGATVVGGVHIRMPDSVCDNAALKKSEAENVAIVKAADEKLKETAEALQRGKYPHEGLGIWPHLVGLFGQRLWFYGKTQHYSDALKISDACIGCGLCAKQCPMQNIRMESGHPVAGNKCTMCYRCISLCPQKAITLLGEKVVEQCRYENYVDAAKMQ